MKIVAFDLETTGVDPFNDVPVSYAVGSMSGLINPGIPIPPTTTEIHGITDAMVEHAIELEGGVFALKELLEGYWSMNHVIVGMNISYDLTMLHSCLKRYGAELKPGRVIDVLVIDRTFDRYRKGSRKLQALADHYEIPFTNAHNAQADADAVVEILRAQIKKWPRLYHVNNNAMETWYVEWLRGFNNHLIAKGNDPIPKGRFSWPINTEEV